MNNTEQMYINLNAGLSNLVRVLWKFNLCERKLNRDARGGYVYRQHERVKSLDKEYIKHKSLRDIAIKMDSQRLSIQRLILMVALLGVYKKVNVHTHGRVAINKLLRKIWKND